MTVSVARRPPPESEPEVPDILTLGQTATHGDWEFEVVEVQRLTSLERSNPRGVYVVVMVDATNEGSSPRQFGGSGWSFHLLDMATDREYEFDSSASLAHHHEFRNDTWHLDDIGPGFTARMPIVFDVPEDVSEMVFARTSWGGNDISPLIILRE